MLTGAESRLAGPNVLAGGQSSTPIRTLTPRRIDGYSLTIGLETVAQNMRCGEARTADFGSLNLQVWVLWERP